MENDIPKYYEIFDRTTLLQRRLVLALNREERWFPTEEISSMLQVNASASLRLIKQLENDIAEFGEQNLELIVSKGKGVRLRKKIHYDIKMFLGTLFSRTPVMKMLLDIFNGKFETVKKYAYKNYISEATVRRYLVKMKQLLEPFNITIRRENAEVQGEESQIRMFLNMLYWQLYRGTIWPFSGIDQTIVTRMVTTFLNKVSNERHFSQLYYHRISYYIGITIMRTRRGAYVQPSLEWKNFIVGNETYEVFKMILLDFRGDLNCKQSEIPFHFTVWTSFFSSYGISNSRYVFKFMESHKRRSTTISEATKFMMHEFEKYFLTIPEDKYSSLEQYLYATHSFCCNFKHFDINIVGHELGDNAPILKKKIQRFIDHLYDISGNSIFLEVQQLEYSYALFFSQISEITRYEPEIVAILESDESILIKEIINQSLTTLLKPQFNFSLFPSESPVKKETVDVVLATTSSLEMKKNYTTDTWFISINRSFSFSDIEKVKRVFKEIVKRKHKEIDTVTLNK
jgi:hypothetical protein